MYYRQNKETGKIELITERAEYAALTEQQQRSIKSAFLFSRSVGGWVSRTKFPNTYNAQKLAESLGAENSGATGERLTFAEQMEQKADRAEAKAERMENRAEQAAGRGAALQKPINEMRGDVAFFTQPNINASGGRSFTRARERMFAAYDRGYEEFKKSEYYADRAEVARRTAAQAVQPKDKAFIDRRIKDAQKTIRAQRENLNSYENYLARLEAGEVLKHIGGGTIEADEIRKWIEQASEIIENAIEKEIYYRDCLEQLGGVQFSQENIKVGYTVSLQRWGACEVTSTGRVNIGYRILTGGAAGLGGSAAYAEIERVISTDVKPAKTHPFEVGESYTVRRWNGSALRYESAEYKIIRRTDKSVTLQCGEEKPVVRKPAIRTGFCYKNGSAWAFFLDESYESGVFKEA